MREEVFEWNAPAPGEQAQYPSCTIEKEEVGYLHGRVDFKVTVHAALLPQYMYGQVHQNRVLYRINHRPGHRYRQLVIVELDLFNVKIFEGESIQIDPKSIAECTDAKIHFQLDLRTAIADLERECRHAIHEGWLPYAQIL